MTQDRLLSIVERAIALQEAGKPVDLEELCKNSPDLIDEVRETLALDPLVTSTVDDGLVGQVLNERYSLRRCIGIGAMGAVYEARDNSLGRTVAVKVLPPGAFGQGKRRERFLREARTLATLNHPNIVPIHDQGKTDHGLHYLVMERLQGGSLASVVSPTHTPEPGGLPPVRWIEEELGLPVAAADYIPQVVLWMLEVVTALHTAHAAGVCHRDVKPSNIFLTVDGRVVLLDFGIAARSGDASMTTKGSALGTPAYMAPEQVRRDIGATPAMDVYGVCATLYHLVALRPPYEGDSIEVLQRIQREDPAPLRSIDKDLPLDLCAIIEQGLERKPERRYADMVELEADLRAFLAHLPVKARPITRWTRAWRHMSRRPIYFVAGMAIATIVLALAIPAAWREIEASNRAVHARLRAALPPSIAVEGSVARRPQMDREERADYIARFDTLLELQPEDIYSRILRCALLQDQGEEAAALADMVAIAATASNQSAYLTELVARYRAFPEAGVGVGDLDLENLPTPASDLDRFVAGFHARRLGDYPAADAWLAEATGFLPARYLRLGVQLALGTTDKQEPDAGERILPALCRECSELEELLGGATARTTYVRGSALFAMGDNEAALLDLERSRELQPEAFGTLNNLGLTYRRLARFENSIEVLEEASRLRPWNLNAALNQAESLKLLTRFDDAIAKLEELGEGDLISDSQRLLVHCNIEIERCLYHISRNEKKLAQQASDRVLAICDNGQTAIPPDDLETHEALRMRATLAQFATERNPRFVEWVIDTAAARPLSGMVIDSVASLLDHPQLQSDPEFARAVIAGLRRLLQAQSKRVYDRPR
ncbi:MAG: protein kinase [bacterium]|nr:protein kinase [bacterium]